jgi:hypothetical protein
MNRKRALHSGPKPTANRSAEAKLELLQAGMLQEVQEQLQEAVLQAALPQVEQEHPEALPVQVVVLQVQARLVQALHRVEAKVQPAPEEQQH